MAKASITNAKFTGGTIIFPKINNSSPANFIKLTAFDIPSYAYLGYSLDISSNGNTAIIGAVYDDVDPALDDDRGGAYIYDKPNGNWVTTDQYLSKLQASDGEDRDNFGHSVAISDDGNTAIIGAYYHNDSIGAAYIFVRSGGTWIEQAKLTPSNNISRGQFGYSVSISGDGNTAVVGAWEASVESAGQTGVVYVFSRSNGSWSEEAQLFDPNDLGNTYLGISVDISSDGNTIVAGRYRDQIIDLEAGSAEIYIRSGGIWSLQSKLLASDGTRYDRFGNSVSISSDGNKIVVGASYDSVNTDPFRNQGSAYIFEKPISGWPLYTGPANTALNETIKLIASDGDADDHFGISVSISGDGSKVIIGAHRENHNGTRSGSAYLFVHSGSTWIEQTKLIAFDGASYDYFGNSVGISSDGNIAIIGAYGDDGVDFSTGSAYVFYV